MRVFVTGASGYIGHAVARAFRAKGHVVYGLVRSNESALQLSQEEIWPIIGDMNNPDSYAKVLENVELAVHCAFETSEKGVELDAKTIETILAVFSKSQLPRGFIYTSGVWVYGSTDYKWVDEASPVNPIDRVKWRPAHEEKVLNSASQNLRTVVMRPGIVFGLVGGLMDGFFSRVEEEGSIAIVGEGHNHWAMIHIRDLAAAYVSAAEKELSRVVLNVVDDASPTLWEIADAIARVANIPGKVHSISYEEGQTRFGPLVEGFTTNQHINNARVKRLLGWCIHHAPFITEVDIHFNAWKAHQNIVEYATF